MKYIDGVYYELTPEDIAQKEFDSKESYKNTLVENYGNELNYRITSADIEPLDVTVTDGTSHWIIMVTRNAEQIPVPESTMMVWKYEELTFKKLKKVGEIQADILASVQQDMDLYFDLMACPDEHYSRNRHKITELFEICFALIDKIDQLESEINILKNYHT